MTKEKYKNRKYSIEVYNSKWKKQFEDEAELLQSIFKDETFSIEHIGSTSVPGLAGKPTIDILMVVKNILIVDEFTKQIESLGYKPLGEYVTKGARLFVKEINNTRFVNLHISEANHLHVEEMLKLRNYFRAHPKTVEEYNKLKFELVEKYPNDYGLYRKYKDEWMEKLKKTIE